MVQPDPDVRSRELARESLAVDDPTGWFERLYGEAESGVVAVPWDRGSPHVMLVEWAREREIEGRGRRALVVGFGLGRDAEFIAGLGFETVAFDVSQTAVRMTKARYPESTVEYTAANLLEPPEQWREAFDLVVESLTVQSLPVELHRRAIVEVGRFVAPGGTLLVISAAADGEPPGPPWPLTRAEIEAFGAGGLEPVRIEHSDGRWRAEFRRPAA
ncbi:MAG TPA: class I SAM-dependent methyltransferase [Actinophytocola sp.]|uniref:class I SAM-dependent methyltransferase n=1 Tax=Actinophytocola sp. TaxID=1872138 RepID=UPI002DDD9878|nr:class I SAM-dependent methyltransferase [Actinophytocola sp.]HEV2780070.1 class I SAM-dependent methyltransferase [Actinophytocola sp.]